MGMYSKILFLGVCLIFSCFSVFSETDYSHWYGNTYVQNQFSDYMTNLHSQIIRNWNPPDTMIKGHVTLLFRVNRRGEVLYSEIVTSSGSQLYDESVIEALRKSEPFPKFPASTSRSSITVKYNFDTSLIKTEVIEAYIENADKFYGIDNIKALENINLAIDAVKGDAKSYFLYGKRSKIKRALGDIQGAEEDFAECKQLKAKFDRRRIMNCKLIAETEKSAFAYFYLANAYDIIENYDKAIEAIDKAISLTELNNCYKRYRAELLEKKSKI